MIEKLSLEDFRKIKEELFILVKNFEQEIDENLYNKDYDENLKEQEFENKYFKMQSKLLAYDLSDIPFEEWEGIEIYSDDNSIADFSNTHANIDFSLINLDNYFVAGSFKGCNIRNLKNLGYMIHEKNFDNITIQNNSSLFLSSIFSQDFKDKYYNSRLNIEDLSQLSSEQLLELKKKNVINHLDDEDRESFIKNLITRMIGIDKSIELYNYSKKDYNYVLDIIKLVDKEIPITKFEPLLDNLETFIKNQIVNSDIKDIKTRFNSYLREFITKSKFSHIVLENIPKDIIIENRDLFLIDESIDEDLKRKYYHRKLRLQDLLYNLDLFDKFPIENFLDNSSSNRIIIKELGYGNLVKLMKKHYDVFKHIIDNNFIYDFSMYLSRHSNYSIERKFILAVKMYYNSGFIGTKPNWLKSMNFNFVGKLLSTGDLMKYDDKTLIEDVDQQKVINVFGIENLKKLEEETKIFSSSHLDFDIFKILSETVDSKYRNINLTNRTDDLDFKLGLLPYEEFRSKFAEYLEILRTNNMFTEYDNYDFIEGNFRNDYPEIFIDKNVPQELKIAFYSNEITPKLLFKNKEYIAYLVDKNLFNILTLHMRLIKTSNSGTVRAFNFIEKYIEIFGNEKTLNLISKYGDILEDIEINYNVWEQSGKNDEELIDKLVKDAIYKKIKFGSYDYRYLKDVQDFTSYHPEIFVDFEALKNISDFEREDLETRYYTKRLVYDDIKDNPELIELLKNKDLDLCFHRYGKPSFFQDKKTGNIKCIKELDLISLYGNEKFLKLCQKYGRYLNDMAYELFAKKYINLYLNETKELSFGEIDKKIEEIITDKCLKGKIDYDEDAPEFLKKEHPELFLSEDTPLDLKLKFYCRNLDFTFFDLKELYMNKTYRHYLEGKKISVALLRNKAKREKIEYFLKAFGEDAALKLGRNKCKTVTQMLNIHDIDLMKKWYDKTGNKFIPDYVVMRNIPFEESDKFLSNGFNWSKLMKLEEFSNDYESRDAMLKLAYSFGVFDGDKRGFNKVYELLTKIPKELDELTYYQINDITLKEFFNVKEENCNIDYFINYYNTVMKNLDDLDFAREGISKNNLLNLLTAIKNENFDLDYSKGLISQIYRRNADNTYTLIINQQRYPKTIKAIREFLINSDIDTILTPHLIHQLFGGFKLEYNPEFREFFLNNLDEILSNSDYQTYIGAIQKKFKNIKIANSNRKLTLDLAISYVQENKYEDVEDGNESVAEISSVAGYDQEDFETLQKIYNYGKQRVFSSIPRIENKTNKYNYEILRLDDPLALAIGTLTDCCQEIGNVAESCMEHSMVDKNGRVFVIRDKEGNIVSQSWVWRNGNVLCFDNIEVPNKAFDRIDNRNKLAQEIYEIYKKAAEELIEKDEKAYKKLFDEGKITQVEYEGLKLKKVTVGIGYNDIAEVLKKNSKKDHTIIRPREFLSRVDLDNNLYTSDSKTQYILKDEEKQMSLSGQPYQVHNDLYKIYDDTNFTKKELIRLGNLEMLQDGYSEILDIEAEENLVSNIADLYELNKDKTKIIMNPNFAIIYEENDDIINIVDLFYNLKAGDMNIDDVVIMKLRLAIEQIKGNKEIDVSNLEENQKSVYNKAINLDKEMDIEKGIKIK